jgi:hypothetical protein
MKRIDTQILSFFIFSRSARFSVIPVVSEKQQEKVKSLFVQSSSQFPPSLSGIHPAMAA